MNKIKTFFLRIAARCNLNCDYCYVFKHRDMSWKDMPSVMTVETVKLFASRLSEYVNENEIDEVNVIFHGGEPLIVGEKKIFEFIDIINGTCKGIKVNFSLQTNGTLLNEELLLRFEQNNVGVSLSIDGDKKAHNRHRRFASGKDSFEEVFNAAKMLKNHPAIFEGVIGVIDPNNNPRDILEFYNNSGLFNMDLLLPDSTYVDKPIGREQNPNLYIDWLRECFSLWFEEYQDLSFRTFEGILSSLMGVKTESDTFGLGCLDYLTIETDGTYHTTDILKITFENASSMNLNLKDASIQTALSNDAIKEYNNLLSYDRLASKCKACKWIDVCGGGSLPHRYSEENGFDNPTIYCDEMYNLIEHAQSLLERAIEKEQAYE